MKRITVLLADDHLIVREGLRTLLTLESDIDVVAEAQTGRQAVEYATKHKPDIAVLDIAMPQMNGLEAARKMIKSVPGTKLYYSQHIWMMSILKR